MVGTDVCACGVYSIPQTAFFKIIAAVVRFKKAAARDRYFVSAHQRLCRYFNQHRHIIAVFGISISRNITAEIRDIDSMIENLISSALDYENAVRLLCTTPGVKHDSAITVISETGIDMSQFCNSESNRPLQNRSA